MRKKITVGDQESDEHIQYSSFTRQYALTIPRPFTVHFNPYTQTIEVVDGKDQIINIVRTLRSMSIARYIIIEKTDLTLFLFCL